jgi:hypothetical protein
MMKKIVLLVALASFFSCSKKQSELDYPDAAFVEPKYDSTPVDSFSGGATSALVARKIKMASQQYQDSLKMAFQKEADLKKQKALEEKMKKELEKAEKKQKEELKTETPAQ